MFRKHVSNGRDSARTRSAASPAQPPEPEFQPVDPKEFRFLVEKEKQAEPIRTSITPLQTTRLTPKRPFKPTEQVLHKIREGFQDLNSVLSGIDEKLQVHNHHSDELNHSVKDLPHASRAGVELLGNISSALESQNQVTEQMVARVQELADKIREIPDAVNRLNERLDRQEEDREKVHRSIEGMQDSVADMQRENMRVHVEALSEFREAQHHDRIRHRENRETDQRLLREIVERNAKQSQVLTVLMSVLILAFVAYLVMAFVR